MSAYKTRAAARAAGSKYFNGWFCPHHPEANGLRYLNNDLCVMCQREKMRDNYSRRRNAKKEEYKREKVMRVAERLYREGRELADNQNVEFDVTFSDLCDMVPENCPVSGNRLWKPVLFRIDDRAPFTAENVMIVSASSMRWLSPGLNDRTPWEQVIQVRRTYKEGAELALGEKKTERPR
jgi:hypothetical protein